MEEWNWETIFTDNIGLYSTTATYMASKEMEIGEKTQNKGYYAVQGHPSVRGRYQSKARVRLLISDYLWPVSYTHLTLPTNREV